MAVDRRSLSTLGAAAPNNPSVAEAARRRATRETITLFKRMNAINVTARAGWSALLAALLTTSCSGGGGSSSGTPPLARPTPTSAPGMKIQHVVLIIQENRSFDNFFATFPGADGTTTGKTHDGKTIKLVKADLPGKDLNHMHSGFVAECDFQGSACKMDGFDTIGFGASGQNGPAGTYPYRYIDPAQIAPYWDDGQAVRARRPPVSDAGQRKLHGPSRSDSGKHRDQRPRKRHRLTVATGRGAATLPTTRPTTRPTPR